MNIALIKAGGIGQRMGGAVPKQFVTIQDKPIIIYTLEQFESHPSIDEIVVVCLEGWHEILLDYCRKYNITKVKKIVNGGSTSLRSIKNGILSLDDRADSDIVLVHDGNRPLISQEIISDVLVQCEKYDSAVAAIPCTDEVMVINSEYYGSDKFMNRKELYRIQTPDAYRLSILRELFDKATEEQLDNIGATNTLMIDQGKQVHFAKGSELNIRLTTQEDIVKCWALLVMEKRIRYEG